MESKPITRRAAFASLGAFAATAALVAPAVALAVEAASPPRLPELIEALRAATANWEAAKAAGRDLEEAVRKDRRRRRPMSFMPGLGAYAEICVLCRADIQRQYDGRMLTILARRGVDGEALRAEALRNYDAAWAAETDRAEQMGAYKAVRIEREAGDLVLSALLDLCAYAPVSAVEAAERLAHIVPLLMSRNWAWGLGTDEEWAAIYSAAIGGSGLGASATANRTVEA